MPYPFTGTPFAGYDPRSAVQNTLSPLQGMFPPPPMPPGGQALLGAGAAQGAPPGASAGAPAQPGIASPATPTPMTEDEVLAQAGGLTAKDQAISEQMARAQALRGEPQQVGNSAASSGLYGLAHMLNQYNAGAMAREAAKSREGLATEKGKVAGEEARLRREALAKDREEARKARTEDWAQLKELYGR